LHSLFSPNLAPEPQQTFLYFSLSASTSTTDFSCLARAIQISEDLYEKLVIYGKKFDPERSADAIAKELIKVGIAALDLQLAINRQQKETRNSISLFSFFRTLLF